MTCPTFQVAGGGRRALVCLHGIGGDATSFAPQLAGLGHACRVVSWTLPGYGASPALPELGFPALADAVARLLDELEIDRCVLVGHSMGGFIAQTFAAHHPDRLDGLILIATSPAFGKPGGDFQREFLAARRRPIDAGQTPADLAPRLVDGLVAADAGPDVRAAAIASMSRIPAEAYLRALECLVTFDGRAGLGLFPCPTLLIAGGEDATAPPAVMRRMAEAIRGARYLEIPGAGHLVNQEKPAETNAAILEFLATLGG